MWEAKLLQSDGTLNTSGASSGTTAATAASAASVSDDYAHALSYAQHPYNISGYNYNALDASQLVNLQANDNYIFPNVSNIFPSLIAILTFIIIQQTPQTIPMYAAPHQQGATLQQQDVEVAQFGRPQQYMV